MTLLALKELSDLSALSDLSGANCIQMETPAQNKLIFVNLVPFARYSKLRNIVCSLALSDSFIAGYQYIGAF